MNIKPLSSIEILDKFISFNTISRQSNIAMIEWIRDYLAQFGIKSELVYGHEHGGKYSANLWAESGSGDGGIVLSGHSDVVPIAGQEWTSDPFVMIEKDGRLYGRGTADMKGFLACALNAMVRAPKSRLKKPLQLAISYDEEIGCLGVHHLLHHLRDKKIKPSLCIIGEPTLLKIGIGHKGKLAFKVACHGVASHSALAPNALNAIYMAADFMNQLRQMQDEIANGNYQDAYYDIPYTTLHTGLINGGVQLNIVPNYCELIAEIRNIGTHNAQELFAQIQARTQILSANFQEKFPNAKYEFTITNEYPGLEVAKDNPLVHFLQNLTGENNLIKLSFGTEAGLFQQNLDTTAVVCGPGSMEQGHKPDEFIAISEMHRCDNFLEKIIHSLL